ncbi:MAG: flagellar basal body rod protein FlgC [Clostridiaceae bacterium BRH_c20a]|nr:MAG: flagellar basal body rod protein FlgC [Clostridiaceae bacterium BRH_c20a]
MSLFATFKVSASGLSAERLRMDVIADNISNAETTRTSAGGPYRRKMVVFSPYRSFENTLKRESNLQQGVKVERIVEDKAPFKLVYSPEHPDAIQEGQEKGYVAMPNVDIVKEMVDMISATRAYEANVASLNAAKSMAFKALEIGRG